MPVMTEIFDFDQIVDRSNSDSAKWERYQGRDILPMWVADSDFAVAPHIQQALRDRVEHPVYGYTQVSARLPELIAERMRRLYQWEVDPRWVVMLPGVIGAFYLACRATSEPGDLIYVPEVVYPPFLTGPGHYSMENQKIPMSIRDQRMIIDMDWLEQQPPRPGRLLMFCNPQNPGGAMYRKDELTRLARIVEQQQLTLVSDEIHCDLVLDRDRRHIPIASLNPQIEQRSITLMAPSKTFNLAGLGCAFAIIANDRLRRSMTVNPYIVPHVNLLGLAAAEAAYEFGDEWNRQQCEYLAANRDYLIDAINRIPGLRLAPIESTYLAWIDVSALGLENPSRFFENAGVGMSPGRDFGDSNYMRLNFGCPRSRVEDAVERIRKAVEGIS
ncbi:MAG: putative C-S lyase [Gammaproteobacteria bacterium]|nr:putative C-S lyase [Gammaproteobacteria bacterium]